MQRHHKRREGSRGLQQELSHLRLYQAIAQYQARSRSSIYTSMPGQFEALSAPDAPSYTKPLLAVYQPACNLPSSIAHYHRHDHSRILHVRAQPCRYPLLAAVARAVDVSRDIWLSHPPVWQLGKAVGRRRGRRGWGEAQHINDRPDQRLMISFPAIVDYGRCLLRIRRGPERRGRMACLPK